MTTPPSPPGSEEAAPNGSPPAIEGRLLRFGLQALGGGLLGGLSASAAVLPLGAARTVADVPVILFVFLLASGVAAAALLGTAALLGRVRSARRRLLLTVLGAPAAPLAFILAFAWFSGLTRGTADAWVHLLDACARIGRRPEVVGVLSPFALLAFLRTLRMGRTPRARALEEVAAAALLGAVALRVLIGAGGSAAKAQPGWFLLLFTAAPAAGVLGLHLGAWTSRVLERRLAAGAEGAPRAAPPP